jgi:hypothetical protein
MREIAYHIKDFAGTDKNVKVLGLSDHEIIQRYVSRIGLDYVNTFFDEQPMLDICNPSPAFIEYADILISSDVMEHVLPPISRAFSGHFTVLKPGGKLILTTPYFHLSSYIEKFPHMISYTVDSEGNVFSFGKNYENLKIEDPIFHGGPGNTLEMRLFAPETIVEGLIVAGFKDVRINEDNIRDHGIIRSSSHIGTITAVKR